MKDKSEIENKRVISRYAIEGKINKTRQKGVPVAGRRKVKYYMCSGPLSGFLQKGQSSRFLDI
jgi:hypothetical protein